MEVMEKTKVLLIQNIKRLRKKGKFNQEQLAEKSGISISFLKDIERGESLGTAATLDALAKGLNVPIAELFSETEGQVISIGVSSVIKKMASVPDDVYDMAERYGSNHEVWKDIRKAFEIYEMDIERKREKAKSRA